jgi:hypothetical protein
MVTVATAGGRAQAIEVRETTDRDLLRAYLERDRLFAAYAICDLDEREFGKTRWGIALVDSEPIAVALEYSGPTPQPLFVMGRPDGIAAILRSVIRPRVAYCAMLPESLPAVGSLYRIDSAPPMVRMAVDRLRFRPVRADVQRLTPIDSGQLNRLYQVGFASWLPSASIANGVNPPALAAYRRLGFVEHVRFEERLIHRLGPPWAGIVNPIRRMLPVRKENSPR